MAALIFHVFNNTHTDGSDATLANPSNWNDGHKFTGGALGSIPVRDTADATYGSNWLASAAGVLVCAGGGVIPSWANGAAGTVLTGGASPAWSASPPLTSVLIGGATTYIDKISASVRIVGNGVGLAVGNVGVSTWNFIATDFSNVTQNVADLGFNASFRTGYFGTALVVGTNPAGSGALRLANGASVNFRNNLNNSDQAALSSDVNDTLIVGNLGFKIQLNASLVTFGGNLSSFPALKRSGVTLQARLADDTGDASLSGYNISASNQMSAAWFAGPGTVASAGDFRAQSGFGLQARNAGNTANGLILSTSTGDATVIYGNSIPIAANATATPKAAFYGSFTVIDATDGYAALFIAFIGGNVALVSDPAARFSVAAGTVNRVNVYIATGNLTIENKATSGGSHNFVVVIVG